MQNKLQSICEDLGLTLNIRQKRHRDTVDFNMKVQLVERIRLASPETLIDILKLFESHSKNLMEKHGSKYMQLKIDSIDIGMYDKIHRYWVFSLLEAQPKTKKIKIIEN
jgi:hypothetical protein